MSILRHGMSVEEGDRESDFLLCIFYEIHVKYYDVFDEIQKDGLDDRETTQKSGTAAGLSCASRLRCCTAGR